MGSGRGLAFKKSLLQVILYEGDWNLDSWRHLRPSLLDWICQAPTPQTHAVMFFLVEYRLAADTGSGAGWCHIFPSALHCLPM
jgi:hypothetical protein